jgi:hypothetical protein
LLIRRGMEEKEEASLDEAIVKYGEDRGAKKV